MRKTLIGLVDRLKKMAERAPFDPARFEDPLATTVSWEPLVRGGTNFGTHRLKEVGMHRRVMRPTFGALAFYLVFVLCGLGALVGAGFVLFAGERDTLVVFAILLAFGLIFGGVGVGLLRSGTKPIVFDVALGYYWKGRQPPPYSLGAAPQDATSLAQVHALQIVSEYCSGSKSSFTSFELNLVLQDGSRRHVVDHGNLKGLRADARELSIFLAVPLWDGTDPRSMLKRTPGCSVRRSVSAQESCA